MDNFYLEVGHNHFGEKKEARKILNFFLKSKFQNITLMRHKRKWYDDRKKQGYNLELDKSFYKEAIAKCHSKKKKIGLSVAAKDTFLDLFDLKFDFYKLLSESINNFELIDLLNLKKKKIFISTGYKAKIFNIKNCLNKFNKKRDLELLHSPMTYDPKEINLQKIYLLRKKFNLKVGFSNHFNDVKIFNLISAYQPDSIFVYCKPTKNKRRIYPDHGHAFYFDELTKMHKDYNYFNNLNLKLKSIKKIKIFPAIKK